MDELQEQARIALINRVLDHRWGDINATLNEQRELVDLELVETIRKVVSSSQHHASERGELLSFLDALADRLTTALSGSADLSVPIEVQKATPLEFLLLALQTATDTDGNSEVVHPIFHLHLRFFTSELNAVLRGWMEKWFAENDEMRHLGAARLLGTFGNLLAGWPYGDRSAALATAVAAFGGTIPVFARLSRTDFWASSHERIGDMFSQGGVVHPASDWLATVAHYRHTLLYYTKKTHPEEWVRIHFKLANIYARSPVGTRADNLLAAIRHRYEILKERTKKKMPAAWAERMGRPR